MLMTPDFCGSCSATAAGNRQVDRQTSPTSGLEVADGEHGNGLSLMMFYLTPVLGCCALLGLCPEPHGGSTDPGEKSCGSFAAVL